MRVLVLLMDKISLECDHGLCIWAQRGISVLYVKRDLMFEFLKKILYSDSKKDLCSNSNKGEKWQKEKFKEGPLLKLKEGPLFKLKERPIELFKLKEGLLCSDSKKTFCAWDTKITFMLELKVNNFVFKFTEVFCVWVQRKTNVFEL